MSGNKRNNIEVNRICEIGDAGMFVKKLGRPTHNDVKTFPHRDDYYMFGFLLSGTMTIAVDFNKHMLKPNDMILITPGQVHKIISLDDDSTGYLLALSPDLLTESEIEIVSKYSLVSDPISLDNMVLRDIEALFEIIQRRGLLSIAKSIVSLAVQYVGNISKGATGRYTSIFIKFKTLLDKNIEKTKRPSDYADMLNITEVYLYEAVRAVTGMSVIRFIMTQVVLNAKRLFVNTDLTAQQIASRLGYIDYPYFSRLFKKIEGMSPTEYRKNLK